MNPWDMLVVTNRFYFNDWLFLYYLAKNMEPYLFRQMLLEHIIPEIQSEENSMIISLDPDDSDDDEKKAPRDDKLITRDLDNHSLNSEDMSIVPQSSLVPSISEKRVKFA